MATELERRIEALEAMGRRVGHFSALSDAELLRRILQLHLQREPTDAELDEWKALSPQEEERRTREMLVAVQRQLRGVEG